ncbi:MAG: hypothetical protein ACF8MJ_06520 [Phycisphaerales bacterium JB050]
MQIYSSASGDLLWPVANQSPGSGRDDGQLPSEDENGDPILYSHYMSGLGVSGDPTRDLKVEQEDLLLVTEAIGDPAEAGNPVSGDISLSGQVDLGDLNMVVGSMGTQSVMLDYTNDPGRLLTRWNALDPYQYGDYMTGTAGRDGGGSRGAQPSPGDPAYPWPDPYFPGVNVTATAAGGGTGSSAPCKGFINHPQCGIIPDCIAMCCGQADCGPTDPAAGGGSGGSGGSSGDTNGNGIPDGIDCAAGGMPVRTPECPDPCGDDDGDGIPNQQDCDSPCLDPNYQPTGSDGLPCDPCADDDGDGIPNQNDCDSPCFDERYAPVGADGESCDPCADDDGDGVPNQEDCDSPCHESSSPGGAKCLPCEDDDQDGIKNQEDCDSDCLHPAYYHLCCAEEIKFKPNPDTHYHEKPSAFTLIPGDRDTIEITLEYPDPERDPGEGPVATIANESVAKLWENGKFVDNILLYPGKNTISVVGIEEGNTTILIDAQDNGCGSFPIVVGGNIEITYARAPGVIPGGPFLKWTDTAKSNSHPGNLAPQAYSAAKAVANSRNLGAILRARLLDGLGDPKPGRPIRFRSKDDKIQFTHPSGGARSNRSVIMDTNREGYSDVRAEAGGGVAQIFPSNQIFLEETVLLTIGETAFNSGFTALSSEGSKLKIDSAVFYTNRIYFNSNLEAVYSSEGDFGTMAVAYVPVMNEPFTIIMDNWLSDSQYTMSERELAFESVFNVPIEIFNGDGTSALFGTGGYEHPFASDSFSLISPSRFVDGQMIQVDMTSAALELINRTYHDPYLDRFSSWSNGGFGYVEDISQPSLGSSVISMSAIAAEFAVGFVPGGDAKDIIEVLIWKPIKNNAVPETQDWVVASVAMVGLAADLGYLAGPTGYATNAITGGIMLVAKYVPSRYVVAIWKVGGAFCDTVDKISQYLIRYPTSSVSANFSWMNPSHAIEWAIQMSHQTVNTLIGIGRSSLLIAGDAVTKSWRWTVERSFGWMRKDGCEGLAYYAKADRLTSLNPLLAGFDDESLELVLEASRRLNLFDVANISDETVHGLAVAAESLIQAGNRELLEEFLSGGAVSAARVNRAFGNVGQLRGVEGLDDYLVFLRNNRSNSNGIEGAIYESTVARAIQRGDLEDFGDLIRVSADGLPGANRIDTITTTHALQIKHRMAAGNYPLSALAGSAQESRAYLDDLALQALVQNRLPVLVLNRPASPSLVQELESRGIMLIELADGLK